MISFHEDDLFISGAAALVNTVNCVGGSGKGLAAQFAKRYKFNLSVYKNRCMQKLLRPGDCLMVFREKQKPKYILNVATKDHFLNPSELPWIERGLDELVDVVRHEQIPSVAVPALGCGLGGLSWPTVLELMVDRFQRAPDVRWMVYPPQEDA